MRVGLTLARSLAFEITKLNSEKRDTDDQIRQAIFKESICLKERQTFNDETRRAE